MFFVVLDHKLQAFPAVL